MTRAITIAARELRERSFVFIAAAVAAIVPFMTAAIRSNSSGPLPVIAAVGLGLAIVFTFGLALALGASMVGRELSEKRLSFYFSKPVSPSAIWFGKLGGALVTVAICFAVIFLPSYLVSHSVWGQTLGQITFGKFVTFVLVASLYLLLIMHALNTMVRSRSALVVLDLSLLAIMTGALWVIVRPLIANLALELTYTIIRGVVFALAVVIVAAGAWQLSRGRTDIRNSHREFSRFFWIAMAVVVGVAGLFVAWVMSAGPGDLRNWTAMSNVSSEWMVLSGSAKHRGDYAPTFLVDTRTGKSTRMPSARWELPHFTRNGQAVVWVVPSPESMTRGRGEVHVRKLGSSEASGTGIMTSMFPRVVLSDDLRRLAIFDRGLLSVYELDSRNLLGSVRIPEGDDAVMFFASPSIVRLYALKYFKPQFGALPGDKPIYEFDVSARKLTETGRFPSSIFYDVNVTRDGSTLIVNRFERGKGDDLLLADARTGAVRATISLLPNRSRLVEPLTAGGLAFVQGNQLRIFGPDGNPVRDISLGNVMGTGMYGTRVRELLPGKKLLVSIRKRYVDSNPAAGSDLVLVDLERGAVERVDQNIALREQYRPDDARVQDRTSDYVISDTQNTLWRWNAVTGEKKKIF